MEIKKTQKTQRPLSPHLQIYRWQLTMIMSILHRITGAALAVGTLLVAWWLIAAAMGEEHYIRIMEFIKTPIGLFMVFGWSAALFYHTFNGVRHLFWDSVHLFKMENAYRSGYLVLLLTIAATAGTWYCAYNSETSSAGQVTQTDVNNETSEQ